MITLIVGGLALLAVIAITVGIVDAAQAPKRRMIAAERRARWEASRQREYTPALVDDDWDED